MVYCVLCRWFWFFLLLTQRQSSWDKWCFHVKPSKSKQLPDYISTPHRWAFTEWCFGTRHYSQPQGWEQGWSVFYRWLSKPEKARALLEHSEALSCLCLPPPTAKLLLAFHLAFCWSKAEVERSLYLNWGTYLLSHSSTKGYWLDPPSWPKYIGWLLKIHFLQIKF